MNEKKGGPLFGIGGVTLLTVLLVLCLTMFSVLALGSAQADYRLSEKNASAVTAYYSAENKAFDLIRQAGEIWPEGSGQPPISAFSEGLRADFGITAGSDGERVLIAAEIPAQEGTCLRVTFSLTGGHTPRWEIIRWQLIPPAQDENDIPTLPVFLP